MSVVGQRNGKPKLKTNNGEEDTTWEDFFEETELNNVKSKN